MTVAEWAQKVGETHPDILKKVNQQARKYKRPSTGFREIASRISSIITDGGFDNQIEIDNSERPRKVRFIKPDETKIQQEKNIYIDLEPISRDEKIAKGMKSLSEKDKYRLKEMDIIARNLKDFFNLKVELDHAQALLNRNNPGEHHPDNLQIISKEHNRHKNNDNWERFSLKEQIDYIKALIQVQEVISKRVSIKIDKEVLNLIFERLKSVYSK